MSEIYWAVGVAILVALLTTIKDWKNDSAKTKLALTILFIIVCAGSIGTCHFSKIANTEKVKKDSLLNVIHSIQKVQLDSTKLSLKKSYQLIDSSSKLLDAQTKLLKAQQELNTAYFTISKLQNSLYNEVTGGNAMPHVIPNGYQENFITFTLLNSGLYSVNDVVISFTDNFDLKRDFGENYLDIIGKLGIEGIQKYARSFQTWSISPNSAIPFYSKQIPSSWANLYFHVNVFWKHGAYTWNVTYRRNEKKEFRLTDSHYYDMKTGKEIYFEKNKK